MINEDIQKKITLLKNRVIDGNEDKESHEYLGDYITNKGYSIKVINPKDWNSELFPIEYSEICDLKRDEPPMSGGLLMHGPNFPLVDPDEEWELFEVEDYPNDLVLLQRDNFGNGFYFSPKNSSVYSINEDFNLQLVGTFINFMNFCLDELINKRSWSSSLNNAEVVKKYNLNSVSGPL